MNVKDRLIVALDVEDVEAARALVRALEGTVSFFKIGFWLLVQPDVNGLIDELVAAGKQVFLDYKMYDIGETVRRGVMGVARRGVSILTVHGDPEIMRSAVAGRDAAGPTGLRIFAVSVLTSMDDSAVAQMGYGMTVPELIDLRVRAAVAAGCDGIIASPTDRPDEIRRVTGAPGLLVATPGIRMAGAGTDDHKRPGAPDEAIAAGADYLVVGRPITQSTDPRGTAEAIVSLMKLGWERRQPVLV